MVYAKEDEKAVYLWWDKRAELGENCVYRVTLDDKACVYCADRLYDFYNLDMSVKHTFKIDVINEKGEILGKTEYFENRQIFPKRSPLDVTQPPYNAVGDGKTDCSYAIKKAFNDCNQDKYVYFPLGVYLCDNVNFDGSVKVVFDAGASLVCKKG